jgi:RHS repeat-associated protein
MTAATASNRNFMDNVYEYDQVNNILGLKNNAPVPSNNLMGGSSDYSYEYDDLYRLVKAEGKYNGTGDNESHAYSLEMSYNTVGGITRKNQLHTNKGQEQKKTTYDMAYTYGDDQPHAPTHIGKQAYGYDANGNQIGWTHDVSGQRRDILWDEENRIRAISDNGANYHYVYDASGTRVIKGKSNGQSVYVNGEWKTGSGSMGNYTVYVNPYIVLKSGGYTKHYYIEGQRIVSKLGGGLDNNGKGPLKAGEGKVNYSTKHDELFEGIVRNLKWLAEDGSILTAGKSGKIPPGQIIGNSPGNGGTESFQYFYHPDHLGSTSYITDASGEVYQHLEYFAFGETFVEEHNNTDKTPYLFNGKELDEETGLYYYGARYYEPQVSIMLSVDRFAEKYPGISPYSYAANNPVKYVDINGDSIVNGSQQELQAIATDLNKIYKDKYGEDGAFSVAERTKTEKVRTNDWSIWDPSSWGNAFEKAEYETKETKSYALAANGDFDWNSDKYTSAMHDLISMKGDVYLDIVQDRGSGKVPFEIDGILKDYGGGFTKQSNWIILSNKLSPSDGSNKRTKWTIGGVAMHELLYHVHPQGQTESSPNNMRTFYNMRTGKDHAAGSNQTRGL